MSRPTENKETLDNALANMLARDFYNRGLNDVRSHVEKGLQGRDTNELVEKSIRSWVEISNYVYQNGNDDLSIHIQQRIIPLLRNATNLADLVYFLLFFSNPLTGNIKFWCPTDPLLLSTLGFPYDTKEIIEEGVGGVKGLRYWNLRPTHASHGLARSATDKPFQYLPDLTERQLSGDVLYPEGDWLVGVKSAVYIAVPTPGVATMCICSPVLSLFGEQEITGEAEFVSNFHSVLGSIRNLKGGESTFYQVVETLYEINRAGAETIAKNWMHQTVGLTHRHRREAENIEGLCCVRLDKFVEVVESHHARDEILSALKMNGITISDVKDDIAYIRETERSRRRFYEFLDHFAYRALGDLAKLSRIKQDLKSDMLRVLEFPTLQSYVEYISDLTDTVCRYQERASALALDFGDDFTWRPIPPLPERGAFDFIFFELLNNAGKYGVESSPIICRAALSKGANKRDKFIEFQFSNVLMLEQDVRGKSCAAQDCISTSNVYFEFKGGVFCYDCLIRRCTTFFNGGQCFMPEITSRGGLFMIKQFIEQFYGGTLSAQLSVDGDKLLVTFKVKVSQSAAEDIANLLGEEEEHV